MLGKTAGGLFWMFRCLERSENTARLIEAGFRIAITRSNATQDEWKSVVRTVGCYNAYLDHHDSFNFENVIDFLIRSRDNPSSVISVIKNARDNAKMVRTALTREVWEATNECWLTLSQLLAKPVKEAELPNILTTITQQSALVRGALDGTMLRNDVYRFAHIGTFLERADNTARLLDVKYYVLLPSVSYVGSPLDNVQWENVLRSVSAQGAFRWLNGCETEPAKIAELMILDTRLPRSLAFCYKMIANSLGELASEYGERQPCHDSADTNCHQLKSQTIQSIFDYGLHEFVADFIRRNNTLGQQIEKDYRFHG